MALLIVTLFSPLYKHFITGVKECTSVVGLLCWGFYPEIWLEPFIYNASPFRICSFVSLRVLHELSGP